MGRARILLVEDEGIIARDIRDSLEGMGYDVIGVEVSGEKAIDTVGRERPDLVLMDVVLQGPVDGIKAASEIRSRYNIPVIYLTAYADEQILERAKPTQPFGYLIKPFEEKELNFTIEMALYKHEMDMKLRDSKEQYQELLESAGAVPWELDLGTMAFTYIGPQMERVLGYPVEDWTDFHFWSRRLHPEDAERAINFCTNPASRRENREFEYRMLAVDGKTVWLRDKINTINGDNGPVKLRGFMLDITERKLAEQERERLILELQDALNNIKALKGLLPICAWCKKIRNDSGYWQQVELYIQEHSDATFTHGMCPECRATLEKELESTEGE
jgi:PAS domain S-box-containing protein